jgi:hypothetical protein
MSSILSCIPPSVDLLAPVFLPSEETRGVLFTSGLRVSSDALRLALFEGS